MFTPTVSCCVSFDVLYSLISFWEDFANCSLVRSRKIHESVQDTSIQRMKVQYEKE